MRVPLHTAQCCSHPQGCFNNSVPLVWAYVWGGRRVPKGAGFRPSPRALSGPYPTPPSSRILPGLVWGGFHPIAPSSLVLGQGLVTGTATFQAICTRRGGLAIPPPPSTPQGHGLRTPRAPPGRQNGHNNLPFGEGSEHCTLRGGV